MDLPGSAFDGPTAFLYLGPHKEGTLLRVVASAAGY